LGRVVKKVIVRDEKSQCNPEQKVKSKESKKKKKKKKRLEVRRFWHASLVALFAM
jgi:hypothetical protein